MFHSRCPSRGGGVMEMPALAAPHLREHRVLAMTDDLLQHCSTTRKATRSIDAAPASAFMLASKHGTRDFLHHPQAGSVVDVAACLTYVYRRGRWPHILCWPQFWCSGCHVGCADDHRPMSRRCRRTLK